MLRLLKFYLPFWTHEIEPEDIVLINYLYVDIQPRLINKDENDGYPKRARVPAWKDAREREGEEGGGGRTRQKGREN